MTARGNTPRDLAQVALVACTARKAGLSMSEAVATDCGVDRRLATKLISRARAAGHAVPLDLPTKSTVGESATRRAVVSVGAHTITRAEYMAATANADRPLTESGIVRYHQSDTMRVIGGWR